MALEASRSIERLPSHWGKVLVVARLPTFAGLFNQGCSVGGVSLIGFSDLKKHGDNTKSSGKNWAETAQATPFPNNETAAMDAETDLSGVNLLRYVKVTFGNFT